MITFKRFSIYSIDQALLSSFSSYPMTNSNDEDWSNWKELHMFMVDPTFVNPKYYTNFGG